MNIKIKGTNQRMKGHKSFQEGNFEQIPSSIDNYLKLKLITANDFIVYKFLYKNDNNNWGYSFPNTKKIALETGLSDKTVKACTKNLEEVGLIRKGKSVAHPNKNIYYVYLPLNEEELFKQVPGSVEKYKEKKKKLDREANIERQRLELLNFNN